MSKQRFFLAVKRPLRTQYMHVVMCSSKYSSSTRIKPLLYDQIFFDESHVFVSIWVLSIQVNHYCTGCVRKKIKRSLECSGTLLHLVYKNNSFTDGKTVAAENIYFNLSEHYEGSKQIRKENPLITHLPCRELQL